MGYSSDIKNKDIMNFVEKWVQLETNIWNEVTQAQKDMHVHTHLQVNNNHKYRIPRNSKANNILRFLLKVN